MTRFERKIVLILVLAGLVPLVVTGYLTDTLVRESVAVGLRKEVVDRLERSVVYHRELLEAWKRSMDLETEAIASAAADGTLADQAPIADLARPALVEVTLLDRAGRTIAKRQASGAPTDSRRYRRREVRRPVPSGGEVVATFVIPEDAIREHQRAQDLARDFGQLREMRVFLRQKYVILFLSLLLAALLLSSAVGFTLARRVTRRIAALHEATEAVGAGDLSVRVPVGPDDEIGELTGAFNRMVEEVADSRGKIAYLSKISVWQDVARRLAHEIKNPLQPIQLAMQELHRRFPAEAGDSYRKLVDSTLEIVGEEVGTLRRLTTEFSTFARLPEVKLEPDDVHQLLRDLAAAPAPEDAPHVNVEWRVPNDTAIIPMDRMLLRRVLDNLVRNAIEAVRAVRTDGSGLVVVTAEPDSGRRRIRIKVSDNGPGVPHETRERLFDPYFTTKADGTGLGLAIVKKVVLDHGGTIAFGPSASGGAEFVVSLPLRTASLAVGPRAT